MAGAARRAFKAGGRALGAVLVVAALWAGGFVWFALGLPKSVADSQAKTDAIVVLTGGSRRLSEGLALLQQGRAGKLFVSGVHRGVDVAELLRAAQRSPQEAECCIALGHEADNTAGNAAETARWMKEQGFRSLRLVTAGYHMPRALAEFRAAMPGVAVAPHPVFPDTFPAEFWWRRGGALALAAAEYTKYLAAALRIALGLPVPGAGAAGGNPA
jgi:uncharacterized SAM-binding protein YcdF (DUF218 family)